MRVKLNGILYETVEDAARVYNVVPNTIRRWLREGRENAAVVKFKGDSVVIHNLLRLRV